MGRGRPRISKFKQEMIRELMREGYSTRQIAWMPCVNVSHTTVWRYLNVYGVSD